ncbi:hypothetical protein FHG87_018109 [Trinorchestia longiramus]|nr:hypothetical protein FHG87_018109 [Trinorchestia longiramus]
MLFRTCHLILKPAYIRDISLDLLMDLYWVPACYDLITCDLEHNVPHVHSDEIIEREYVPYFVGSQLKGMSDTSIPYRTKPRAFVVTATAEGTANSTGYCSIYSGRNSEQHRRLQQQLQRTEQRTAQGVAATATADGAVNSIGCCSNSYSRRSSELHWLLQQQLQRTEHASHGSIAARPRITTKVGCWRSELPHYTCGVPSSLLCVVSCFPRRNFPTLECLWNCPQSALVPTGRWHRSQGPPSRPRGVTAESPSAATALLTLWPTTTQWSVK